MARIVRCGLIQAQCGVVSGKVSRSPRSKKKMIAKHERLIADAARKKSADPRTARAFLRPVFSAPNSKLAGMS